uniref:NADH-ubiquinone oxidoreductase chain 4 n=1 Tax=Crassicauda sp. Ningbo-2019 TaxID=2860933 RepID=A0A8F6U4H4_9BILA|nr:NADH dehydrogenase subunit 4 [Crassicauda sp. Ningbo-2019]WHL46731.1 NADH dehydrogenase subunit 4 [Crassicauda magna]
MLSGLVVIYDFFFFFFFFVVLVFFGLFDYFWSGGIFFYDSLNYVLISFMSVFLMGFIFFSESSISLNFYVLLVIFFSILFFFSNSVVFFYVFYELTLIPVIFALLGYGRQVEKISACYYLVFYTLFFGMPFLFVISYFSYFFVFVYFDFLVAYELMFFLSLCFLVKFPVYLLHLWLPKAHVEASTSISMLLAGVMLKLGGVGVYRFCKSLNFLCLEFWLLLSFLGMIFCSFICLMQSDGKSLAAYSSICHMGFVLLSEVCMVIYGKSMGLLMMLSHGYTSALMFYLIGEYYHCSGSRLVYYMRGFFNGNLMMILIFCLVMMSNFSFPPSLSFFSEYVLMNFFLSVFVFGFFLLMLYYLASFYYSIYLLVCLFFGYCNFFFFEGRMFFCLPIVFMMFNFFWLCLII